MGRRTLVVAAVFLASTATVVPASRAQEHAAPARSGERVSIVPPKPTAVTKDGAEVPQAKPLPNGRYVPSKPVAELPRRGTVVSQPDPPAPVRGKTTEPTAAVEEPAKGTKAMDTGGTKELAGRPAATPSAKAAEEPDEKTAGSKPAPRSESLQERIAKRIAALQAAREAKAARPAAQAAPRIAVPRETPTRRVKLDWNTALTWPSELTHDLDADRDRQRR